VKNIKDTNRTIQNQNQSNLNSTKSQIKDPIYQNRQTAFMNTHDHFDLDRDYNNDYINDTEIQ